jgi:hypothetical protein
MKIKMIKNHRDKSRYRLKGQILDVTPIKGEEYIQKKVAEVVFKDVETAERIDRKEKR